MQGRQFEYIIRENNPSYRFESMGETGGSRYTEGYVRHLEAESIREVNNASARGKSELWRNEVATVRGGGAGSVEWSFQQTRELLSTGRVSGYEVHHVEPISMNPARAGDIGNMRILSISEHREIHRAGK